MEDVEFSLFYPFSLSSFQRKINKSSQNHPLPFFHHPFLYKHTYTNIQKVLLHPLGPHPQIHDEYLNLCLLNVTETTQFNKLKHKDGAVELKIKIVRLFELEDCMHEFLSSMFCHIICLLLACSNEEGNLLGIQIYFCSDKVIVKLNFRFYVIVQLSFPLIVMLRLFKLYFM